MVADSEKGSRAKIFARSQETGQEFNAFKTGNLNEFFEVPNEIELTDWKTLKSLN